MYKSFLVAMIYFVIFLTSQTTMVACEHKYFWGDSTSEYKEECLVNIQSGKNCPTDKSFLVLLADVQRQNQVAIYKLQKSAWLAFGLSVLYPGLGQLYNGEYGKAFLMAGLETLGLAAFYYGASSTDFDGKSDNDTAGTIALTGVFVCGAVYIWSLIDAPVSANIINRNAEADASIKLHRNNTGTLSESSVVKIKLQITLNF